MVKSKIKYLIMSNTIRVVLADDHVFVRDGIKFLLENESNINVIGEAVDGQDALKVVGELDPDLLILDIRMPNLTGIEVVEKLRNDGKTLKIVMLSMHESEEYVLKSIKAGADGYLLKGSSKEEFLKAVHTVANGGKYFSGDISSILIGQLSNPNPAVFETKKSIEDELLITKREKEILTLLLAGKGNKEIADTLDISKRTAEVHRFNLMKKLKVKNLMELSNKATEFSLL
jgi:two-component system, NarL family, nitrate/nitrite response regulator NarL